MLAIPLLMSPIVYLRDVSIRTQRAAVASRRATNLATQRYANLYDPNNDFSDSG